MLHQRRLRDRYFTRIMFGEPAWDILLILYTSDQPSSRSSMIRLAKWTETPLTTVVSWVSFLEEQKLVQRQPHPTDRRTIFVQLTGPAKAALDGYFGADQNL